METSPAASSRTPFMAPAGTPVGGGQAPPREGARLMETSPATSSRTPFRAPGPADMLRRRKELD
ncbi:MAG: hypothetical protein LBT40_02495 [Deltaproteobacteria bacterium]|jgi:hypothetical protein|nr:hypothetical protein [Deltaproteobacteria bacterium]